jgi:release factor glutamine methyltransferase
VTAAQTGPGVVRTAGDESIGLPALLSEVTALLAEAGVPSPRVDAETLAAAVLELSRGVLAARAAVNAPVEAPDAGRIRALAQARAARVPLQHLTGQAWFRTVTVRVGAGVFVPRPETEVVAGAAIDEAARLARAGRQPLVVDLGTGSGAIAAAVAAEVPAARVHAVERAPHALDWAKVNLAGTRVQLHAADLATALDDLNGLVDVVVSNPPYIPDGSVPRDPEVRDYDPPEALYGGGADGLATMRLVIAAAGRLLAPGGLLVVEHGETQGAAVRALLGAPGWESVGTAPDLTDRPRYTTARRVAGSPTWARRDLPGDQRDRRWRL